MTTRKISDIAREIQQDWKNPYFGALPYIAAMKELESINDDYGADSAAGILSYFLGNAQTWKGEVARRVKKELNGMINKNY
jgi:hypothetical protein